MDVSYRVAVTREDGVWVADVLDVPGAHTSASRLEELEARVQEVIGLVLDRPEAERFELEFVGSARLLRSIAEWRGGQIMPGPDMT